MFSQIKKVSKVTSQVVERMNI